jgi:hypothetical protein
LAWFQRDFHEQEVGAGGDITAPIDNPVTPGSMTLDGTEYQVAIQSHDWRVPVSWLGLQSGFGPQLRHQLPETTQPICKARHVCSYAASRSSDTIRVSVSQMYRGGNGSPTLSGKAHVSNFVFRPSRRLRQVAAEIRLRGALAESSQFEISEHPPAESQ